jgi:hypothetical protein
LQPPRSRSLSPGYSTLWQQPRPQGPQQQLRSPCSATGAAANARLRTSSRGLRALLLLLLLAAEQEARRCQQKGLWARRGQRLCCVQQITRRMPQRGLLLLLLAAREPLQQPPGGSLQRSSSDTAGDWELHGLHEACFIIPYVTYVLAGSVPWLCLGGLAHWPGADIMVM